VGADADLVRRLTDEAFIGGNLEVLDELVATDFVSHDPPPGAPGTKEGLQSAAEAVVAAFSDRKMEFDELVDTADGRVVDSWAMVGTHTGEAFGLPASNQSVRVRGIELWRCSGGKIVEHWGAIDLSDVAQKAQA
jgi:steroid delta-isomerase-like uncharacterized protein